MYSLGVRGSVRHERQCMSKEPVRITRPTVTARKRPTGGLKQEAIAHGAHPSCMAAGRAGACPDCRVIIDRIIDRNHTVVSEAAARRKTIGIVEP